MKLPKYQHKRARIEIVPMIDTIFFLLVYFMVASLTMTPMPSKHVKLPVSVSADQHPEEKVVVTASNDGNYYIDRNLVDEKDIKGALVARLQGNPNLTVVINCDKDQSVARFRRVFDLVKHANAAQVMIATTPKDSWVAGQ